jgi:hypothetical protein
MIIFSEPNDTPASIAHRYLGYSDASKAKEIRLANCDSLSWHMMNESGYYSPHRALWFPIDGEDTPPHIQHLIAHEFDWLTCHERYNLAKAQKQGINIHHALYAHQMNTFMNAAMGAGATSLDSLHSAIELRSDHMQEFQKLLQQAKTQLGQLADAETKELRLAARHEFGETYNEITTKYYNYFKRLDADAKYQLKKPWKVIRGMKNQGWVIDDLYQAKAIGRMVKYLKFTKIGGYAVMTVTGIAETYEAWEHTHSWEATAKEALKVIVDVGTVALLTFIAGTVLTLVGITAPVWATCLIIGAAAVTMADVIDDKLINPIIEKI